MAPDVVSKISVATNTVVGNSISVGRDPIGVAAVGTRVYVANSGSNTVSVIDTVDGRVLTNIKVGRDPRLLAVKP